MCVGGGGSSRVAWDDPNYGHGGITDPYPKSRASQNNFTPKAESTSTTTTASTTTKDDKDSTTNPSSKLTISGPNLTTTPKVLNY